MFTNLWAFVSAWYNLPFTVSLAVSALLAGLQWLGLGGDPDAEPDLDAELDGGPDGDADLETDLSAETEPDSLDEPTSGEVDGESAAPGLSLLAFIGIGKAPMMVVLATLFAALGILGWSLNALGAALTGGFPAALLALTGPAALLGSAGLTGQAARWMGRALPPVSTTASSAESLVGRAGTVISPFVDQRYGLVHLRDQGGTLISVFAVAISDEPIKRGDPIVLVRYLAERKCYGVIRSKAAL